MTTFIPRALSSSARNRAAEAPVIPDPTTTTSAVGGNSGVVRWPSRNFEGSLCQNEAVDFSLGRPALLLEFDGMLRSDIVRVMARVEDGGTFMALGGVLVVVVKVVFQFAGITARMAGLTCARNSSEKASRCRCDSVSSTTMLVS